MPISVVGGPFDGALSDGPANLPLYIIGVNHPDHPIYKRACCGKCSSKRKAVPYFFVGYETESYRWQEQEFPEVVLES